MRLSTWLSSIVFLAAAACGSHNNGGGPPDSGDGNNGDAGNTAPTMITVTLTNHPTTAATFTFLTAYRDGNGAWTAAPAPTGDTYSFMVSSSVWSFVWTCVPMGGAVGGNVHEVNLRAFAVSERTSFTETIPQRCTDHMNTTYAVSGTVTAAAIGSFSEILNRQVLVGNNGAYSVETSPGTRDLLVGHPVVGGGAADSHLDTVFIQRGIDVTAATTQNVNYANAAATQTFAVTVTGANPRTVVQTDLFTANRTTTMLTRTGTAPYETRSLAAAQMVGTDVYAISVTFPGTGAGQTITQATATPAAITLSAPAALGGSLVSIGAATPYPQVKSTWTAYPNAIGYTWTGTQGGLPAGSCGGTAGCSITWAAQVSSGAIGASSSYQMPDLSAISGFGAMFQPVTGTVLTGSVEAMTSSAGAMDFPAGIPTAGTTRMLARDDYTIMP